MRKKVKVGDQVSYQGKEFTVNYVDENGTNLQIENEHESHSSVDVTDIEVIVRIKIMLKTEDCGIHQIGEIVLNPNIINAVHEHMYDYPSNEHLTIVQVGKLGVECESYAYLYQVYKDSEIDFYFVEHGKLYDENGYLSEVFVGEKFGGFDDLVTAYKAFVEKVCERWQ